jgi:nicotinamidase-related amidase
MTNQRAVELLPPALVKRLIRRRGSAHAFAALQPAATALVVVDMTNLFVGETAEDRLAVERINTVAAALRQAGGAVQWLRPAPFAHPALMQALMGEAVAAFHEEAQREDDPRSALHPSLDVHALDLQARKNRYGGFFPDAGDAAFQLRQREIDTVLIAGTVTNVCVEATARDAFACGFRVIMLADACRGSSTEAHLASLAAIHRNFGDVRNTWEVLELLDGTARP